MERLTEWRDGHGALIRGDGYTKLAQYEDTGLTPGDVIRLSDRLNAAEECICKVEDALERGSDNDWAREVISEYEAALKGGEGI